MRIIFKTIVAMLVLMIYFYLFTLAVFPLLNIYSNIANALGWLTAVISILFFPKFLQLIFKIKIHL